MKKLVGYSESGQPVYRYDEEPEHDWQIAEFDEDTYEQIQQHIERYIGEAGSVFHEIISNLVHIDVHLIRPTSDRDYYTLITTGMSSRPMNVPEELQRLQFAELMLCLPSTWDPSETTDVDERAQTWPVDSLRFLARFPHIFETWFGYGHSIPNGDPADKIFNTRFTGYILYHPVTVDEDFIQLKINEEKTINFYSVIPVYKEEMAYKLKYGGEALWEKLTTNGITELLNPLRKNVCKQSRFSWFK